MLRSNRTADGSAHAARDLLHVGRLPGGIPIPVVVLGLPLAAVICIAIAMRVATPLGASPAATPLRTADLIFEDRDNGSIDVVRAADHRRIEVLAPGSNAFLRVLLSGLVRERRREHEGDEGLPFRITRWADGRLTIDDIATHKLIELDAFGPSNAGAFARLLDRSVQSPQRE
jgi:putative photosynthetic complex assembly protein